MTKTFVIVSQGRKYAFNSKEVTRIQDNFDKPGCEIITRSGGYVVFPDVPFEVAYAAWMGQENEKIG
jgi:hypothetical protein